MWIDWALLIACSVLLVICPFAAVRESRKAEREHRPRRIAQYGFTAFAMACAITAAILRMNA